MRVLIVEDELKMASLLRRGLLEDGHAADVAAKGEDALWMARATDYDAIVLDVMLPGLTGFEVCRRLRADGVWSPVLMLTARDAVQDRIAGLDNGADDYLTKPFRPKELVARVKAILRRAVKTRGRPAPAVYRTGDIVLDEATHQVSAADVPVHLSPTEFKLLRHFMANAGRVLTQEEILEGVWGYDAEVGGDLVKLNVSRLRRKLASDGQARDVIQTVPGVGYLFRGADGGVVREEARRA